MSCRSGESLSGTLPGVSYKDLLRASFMNAQELRAQAGQNLAFILEVARKSVNLKGEFVGRLKKSASLLRDVVDALAGRTEAEEKRRRLRDNSRLRFDLEACKAEVKAIRRGFTEAKADTAAATAAAAGTKQATPTIVLGVDLMKDLKRSLIGTIGDILNTRFAGIEDRLLPAPSVRPPLRATSKKTLVPVTVPPVPAPKPVPPRNAASKKAAGMPAPAGQRAVASSPAPVVHAAQIDFWATLVRKGKGKGKKSPAAAPTTVTAPAPHAPIIAAPGKKNSQRKSKKPALSTPKSAAVVFSLQPQASEKGVTYSAVMQAAQKKVDLQELGIEQLRFRKTAIGARKMEVPGSGSSGKADTLAEKLRVALSEVATVSRPHKSAELDITGLDDAATKDVVAAIAKAGGCDVGQVKAGEIRRGPGGVGASLVSCPVAAAKAVLQKAGS